MMFDLGGWNIGFWLTVVIDIVAGPYWRWRSSMAAACGGKRPQDPKTVEVLDAATWELYHPDVQAERPSVRHR